MLSLQYGDTAVILATVNNHIPVMNVLVLAGADLNLANNVWRYT